VRTARSLAGSDGVELRRSSAGADQRWQEPGTGKENRWAPYWRPPMS